MARLMIFFWRFSIRGFRKSPSRKAIAMRTSWGRMLRRMMYR